MWNMRDVRDYDKAFSSINHRIFCLRIEANLRIFESCILLREGVLMCFTIEMYIFCVRVKYFIIVSFFITKKLIYSNGWRKGSLNTMHFLVGLTYSSLFSSLNFLKIIFKTISHNVLVLSLGFDIKNIKWLLTYLGEGITVKCQQFWCIQQVRR